MLWRYGLLPAYLLFFVKQDNYLNSSRHADVHWCYSNDLGTEVQGKWFKVESVRQGYIWSYNANLNFRGSTVAFWTNVSLLKRIPFSRWSVKSLMDPERREKLVFPRKNNVLKQKRRLGQVKLTHLIQDNRALPICICIACGTHSKPFFKQAKPCTGRNVTRSSYILQCVTTRPADDEIHAPHPVTFRSRELWISLTWCASAKQWQCRQGSVQILILSCTPSLVHSYENKGSADTELLNASPTLHYIRIWTGEWVGFSWI